MSRLISYAVDITPNLKRTWTVLVQVLEHGHVQETRSKRKFKRLVLTDSQGTTFTALIYDSDLRYFSTLLTQYKRYYISNAIVIDNEAKYRISSYLYSWLLNNKTLVEEFVDTVPITLPSVFEFTKFSDLHRYAEIETLQNVRAIVLHCFPIKEQGPGLATRRDIVIVNEEKILLLLTLWEPFAEEEGNALANMINSGPMIFGMRLRVTTFNCISLTTRSASGLMINPPATTTELQMQEWYNTNKKDLQTLLQMKAYKKTDMLLPYPKDTDIVTVTTIVSSLKTFKTGWIKGKTSLFRQQSNFWYTACSNCHKSLDVDLTWIVTCPSCRLESEVEPRSRITIHIDDGTSTISAIIYTPNAEKLIPFTAVDLKEADENSMDLQKDIAESLEQHTIVAFICLYESTPHAKSETRFHVLKAYTLDEKLSPTNLFSLQENISNIEASGSDLPITTPPTCKTKEPLFSPSTKLIVDEIGSSVASKPAKNIASKSAKRSLTFSDEDYLCKTNTAANKPLRTLVSIKKESASQGNAQSTDNKTDTTSTKEIATRSTHESPNKKHKD